MFDSIFLKVVEMTLATSVVIPVVMLARLLLKKAPKVFSYTLWAVVLFRLLCPVVPQISISVPAEAESQMSIMQEAEIPASDGTAEQAAPSPKAQARFLVYGKYIWALGICVMLFSGILACMKLRRSVLGAALLRKNIYIVDHIRYPFTKGIFRPRIYLPSALSVGEHSYIIAHEEHHIKHFDNVIRLLSYAALCLHWFNPLVWAAFTLSGKDMEMRCDEAVLQRLGPDIRAAYSASLLNLAAGHRVLPEIHPAFGEKNTKGRIMNIANWKKPRKGCLVIAALLCLTVLAACAHEPQITASPRSVGQNTSVCTDSNCTDQSHSHEVACMGSNCTDASHGHEITCTDDACTDKAHEHAAVCTDSSCTDASHGHEITCTDNTCTDKAHGHATDCAKINCTDASHHHTAATTVSGSTGNAKHHSNHHADHHD